MRERLVQLDTELFLWLNGHHNPFWDQVMIYISGKWEWMPFYLIILGIIIYKYKWKCLWIFLSITILIALSDCISTRIIKETFERLRPSHNPELEGLVHIVNGRGGNFGFISSHAANTFALATFLSFLFRKKWFSMLIFLWAFVVSYSRIYLGVHYPADILGGAFLGMMLGILVFYIYTQLLKRYADQPIESHDRINNSE